MESERKPSMIKRVVNWDGLPVLHWADIGSQVKSQSLLICTHESSHKHGNKRC